MVGLRQRIFKHWNHGAIRLLQKETKMCVIQISSSTDRPLVPVSTLTVYTVTLNCILIRDFYHGHCPLRDLYVTLGRSKRRDSRVHVLLIYVHMIHTTVHLICRALRQCLSCQMWWNDRLNYDEWCTVVCIMCTYIRSTCILLSISVNMLLSNVTDMLTFSRCEPNGNDRWCSEYEINIEDIITNNNKYSNNELRTNNFRFQRYGPVLCGV